MAIFSNFHGSHCNQHGKIFQENRGLIFSLAKRTHVNTLENCCPNISGTADLIRILVELGANIEAEDNSKRTPIARATDICPFCSGGTHYTHSYVLQVFLQ